MKLALDLSLPSRSLLQGVGKSTLPTYIDVLGSRVAEWWDYTDGSTMTFIGSKAVTIIGKKQGIIMTQANAAKQAVFSATARNGKGGLIFTGAEVYNASDARITTAGYGGRIFSAYNGMTGSAVSYSNTYGNNQAFQCVNQANTGPTGVFGGLPGGSTGDYDGSDVRDEGIPLWAGCDCFLMHTGSTFTNYSDGVARNGTCGQIGIGTAVASCGGDSGGTPGFVGVVQDQVLMAFGSTYTQKEIDLCAGIDSWKNGKAGSNLPVGHAFKSRAPIAADI